MHITDRAARIIDLYTSLPSVIVKELKEALKAEDVETTEVATNKENTINLSEYKAMFAFADMLVDDSKELQIKETGEFTMTMTLGCGQFLDLMSKDVRRKK